MLKESLYYSKILLFGEYGIIHDSMGLSIPYNDYNGKLLFSTNLNATSSDSNQKLVKFQTLTATRKFGRWKTSPS